MALTITWWHQTLALVTTTTTTGQMLSVTLNNQHTMIQVLHWHPATGILIISVNNLPYRWQLLCELSCSCWQWYSFTHDATITLQRLQPLHTKTPPVILFTAHLKSPIGGRVLRILIKEGDFVTKGTALLIIESMKMENEIRAPHDAFIKTVSIRSNDVVEADQLVIVFAKKGAPHGLKSTPNG